MSIASEKAREQNALIIDAIFIAIVAVISSIFILSFIETTRNNQRGGHTFVNDAEAAADEIKRIDIVVGAVSYETLALAKTNPAKILKSEQLAAVNSVRLMCNQLIGEQRLPKRYKDVCTEVQTRHQELRDAMAPVKSAPELNLSRLWNRERK